MLKCIHLLEFYDVEYCHYCYLCCFWFGICFLILSDIGSAICQFLTVGYKLCSIVQDSCAPPLQHLCWFTLLWQVPFLVQQKFGNLGRWSKLVMSILHQKWLQRSTWFMQDIQILARDQVPILIIFIALIDLLKEIPFHVSLTNVQRGKENSKWLNGLDFVYAAGSYIANLALVLIFVCCILFFCSWIRSISW